MRSFFLLKRAGNVRDTVEGLWIIVDSEKYTVRAVAELGLFRWPEKAAARSSASHGTRRLGRHDGKY
jgi:hypothetical protein